MDDFYSVLIAIAKKKASQLTIKEINEILEWEATTRREAIQIIEVEIPDLIKYLDFLYPTQQLIGFKKFTRGQYE